MSLDSFWSCVDALAASLESDSDVESTEADLAKMPADVQQAKRYRLKLIAAQLSRVEVRMMAREGYG